MGWVEGRDGVVGVVCVGREEGTWDVCGDFVCGPGVGADGWGR